MLGPALSLVWSSAPVLCKREKRPDIMKSRGQACDTVESHRVGCHVTFLTSGVNFAID
jgi:hypothetical protein